MNSDLISKLLLDLLNNYDRVSLPGLGSFTKGVLPATISAYGTLISPPVVKIEFRTTEIWDDELLEKKYAEHEGLSFTLAKEEVSDQMKQLKAALQKSKKVSFPGLGTLNYISDDNISFTLSEEIESFADSYGLAPVNIKPLLAKGEIEQLSGRVYNPEFKDSGPKRQYRQERAPATSRASVPKRAKRPNKGLKIFLYILISLIVIAVLLALIYIFREDLKPYLEMVLYNREERELLQLIK